MTAALTAALVALAAALLGSVVALRRARRLLSDEVASRLAADEATQQLASIVESSADAILTTTLQGRIRTWSAGAQRMYGHSEKDVQGHHISLLHPPDRRESGEELLERIGGGKQVLRMETVNWTRDGQAIEVGLTISPLRDRTGRIVGACTVARDITDRKALERVKDEFVGTVSHELRTPLTAIKGFIELVADGEAGSVNERQREFLDIAARNTERLGALIDDLLDTEKLESRRLQIRDEPVDLEAVLGDVAATFRHAAWEKGLAFREEIRRLPSVAGDRDRLIQVFSNLVSNAIKYTPRGEIGISATSTEEGAEVVVRDTGIGLTVEERERLFAKFFRGSHPVVAEAGGTGLGLAIVKAVVERHRGTIQVESEAGRGSRFRVVLPALR